MAQPRQVEQLNSASTVAQVAWRERSAWFSLASSVVSYIRVLKPRETVLLGFIGICSALLAGGGSPPWDRFLLAAIAVIIGSGGSNGLTNYLDRHVDARMVRTRRRVLPAGLLLPQRALIWSTSLVSGALLLAWYLHPAASLAAATAVAAALVARKTWATHFLGAWSSTGPVLVGWLAVNPRVDGALVALVGVVILWVPVHVWNLMIAYQDDYRRAGVNIFPLTWGMLPTYRLCLLLTLLLYGTTLALWSVGDFGWLYLVVANVVGPLMVFSGVRLLRLKQDRAAAFRTFKVSAYPFLGLTFLGLVADTWLRAALG